LVGLELFPKPGWFWEKLKSKATFPKTAVLGKPRYLYFNFQNRFVQEGDGRENHEREKLLKRSFGRKQEGKPRTARTSRTEEVVKTQFW
jgi:hypothetical protein